MVQCARQLIGISSISVTMLPGIYHLQFLSPRAGSRRRHLRQRADRCLIDVRHLKHFGSAPLRRPYCDDRRSCLLRLHDQRNLCRHGIDCVHDVRIARKIELVSSPADKASVRLHPYSPGLMSRMRSRMTSPLYFPTVLRVAMI